MSIITAMLIFLYTVVGVLHAVVVVAAFFEVERVRKNAMIDRERYSAEAAAAFFCGYSLLLYAALGVAWFF